MACNEGCEEAKCCQPCPRRSSCSTVCLAVSSGFDCPDPKHKRERMIQRFERETFVDAT